MSNVVIELQKACLDSSISYNFILLKAYFIAKKLNLREMVDFCEKEIYGYQKTPSEDIPGYRIITPCFHAKRFGQPDWDVLIAPDSSPFSTEKIIDPIACIEKLVSSTKEVWTKAMNDDERNALNALISDVYPIMRRAYPIYLFSQILMNVRMNILNWAIDLENCGIRGNNFSFSIDEKENAQNTKSINIISIAGNANNSNLAGMMMNSSATVNNDANPSIQTQG